MLPAAACSTDNVGQVLRLAGQRFRHSLHSRSMAAGEFSRQRSTHQVVCHFLTVSCALSCLQLEAFDQRTGVISSAKETTSVIAQKALGAMSKAAEDKRVQGVVTNVSTGW